MNEQYQLRFLVIPDVLYQDIRLTSLELKIAGFIHSYKGDRFYFSNEHLGKMFNAEAESVSRCIRGLIRKGLIGVDYEIKAGGGKIRFIRSNIQSQLEGLNQPVKSDLTEMTSRIYKEIKENKVKEIKKKYIKKKDFSVHNPPNLTQSDFQEIAESYSLPISFVISKYDDMVNWFESNPRKNQRTNWKATLRQFVKKDAISLRREQSAKTKITFIA